MLRRRTEICQRMSCRQIYETGRIQPPEGGLGQPAKQWPPSIPAHKSPRNTRLFSAGSPFFDELFFKSLENYCTSEAVVSGDDHTRRGECRYQRLSLGQFTYTPDDVRRTIIIYRNHRNPHDPTERLDRYLGTLLHEIVHAFLRIYSCHCRLACYENTQRLIGDHGRAWQHVISNVRTAVPHFLRRDLDLRGEHRLANGILKLIRTQNIILSKIKLSSGHKNL